MVGSRHASSAADNQAKQPGGLQAYLSARNPQWRLVGRVTLHLAENKRDPDHPFAFLATYIPKLSSQGRVQHEPLGKALKEYAGAKNRPVLLSLLVPIQRATENSPLIRELVESGEIYHPLAWSPREAYRFLQDIPVFEESGLIVRVPDWWKSSRPPRPAVNVKIDARKGTTLTVDALLDFSVNVTLDGEPLTEAELKRLLQSVENCGRALKERSGSKSTAISWLRHWSTGKRSSTIPERTACRSMRECGSLPVCPANKTPSHPFIRIVTGLD